MNEWQCLSLSLSLSVSLFLCRVSRNNWSQSSPLSLSLCLSLALELVRGHLALSLLLLLLLQLIYLFFLLFFSLGFCAAPAARQEIQFTTPKCENKTKTKTKTKTKDKQFPELRWKLPDILDIHIDTDIEGWRGRGRVRVRKSSLSQTASLFARYSIQSVEMILAMSWPSLSLAWKWMRCHFVCWLSRMHS